MTFSAAFFKTFAKQHPVVVSAAGILANFAIVGSAMSASNPQLSEENKNLIAAKRRVAQQHNLLGSIGGSHLVGVFNQIMTDALVEEKYASEVQSARFQIAQENMGKANSISPGNK